MELVGVEVERHTAVVPVSGVILLQWELPARVRFRSLNLSASSFVDDAAARDCSVAQRRM